MVVALLADGLTNRGHDVTLFASGGSKSRADLVTFLDEAPGTGNVDTPVELTHTLGAYTRAEDFDLIYDHSVLGAAVGGMLGGHPPVVHTLHGPWSDTIRPNYGLLHDRIHPVAISERFFPGGINSLRGYPLRSIAPTIKVPSGNPIRFATLKLTKVLDSRDTAAQLGIPLKNVRVSVPGV